MGEFFFFSFFIIFSLLAFLLKDFNYQILLNFLVLITLFFLIGTYDDIYAINANLRLLLLVLTLLLFFNYNDQYLISGIYFSFNKSSIDLNFLSVGVTVFCFILLINSLNMSDGINGLTSSYFISFFSIFSFFIFKSNIFFEIILLLIILLTIFLYLNLKSFFFLGDSGVYVLTAFLSLFLLISYDYNAKTIGCDQIALVMLFPGLDMLRIFIERIYKKKNPFNADINHLHHLFLYKKKFNEKKIIVLFNSTIILSGLFSVYNFVIFGFVFIVGIYFSLYFYAQFLK